MWCRASNKQQAKAKEKSKQGVGAGGWEGGPSQSMMEHTNARRESSASCCMGFRLKGSGEKGKDERMKCTMGRGCSALVSISIAIFFCCVAKDGMGRTRKKKRTLENARGEQGRWRDARHPLSSGSIG